MYIYFLYSLTVLFLGAVVIKANKHKEEWLLLLLILSYVKTCITYLFGATTVFTVANLGGTQIHVDDIVLILELLFCLSNILHPIRGGKYIASTLLLLIPTAVSLCRGMMMGTIGSAMFLADTRKFISFLVTVYAFFFLLRRPQTLQRMWKYEQYIDTLMNVVLIYTVIIWILDAAFGMHSLPGQINGTLSDGGSTFRIISAPQSLMIAFYALYKMHQDISSRNKLSARTLTFAGIIVLLQWRTVVAAFLVGVVIMLALYTQRNGLSRKLSSELAVMVAFAFAISLRGDGSSGISGMVMNLFESFSNVQKGVGTFSTRTEVWEMILGSLKGTNALFGRPFGQNLGLSWTVSAHSGYVDYISKMGYFGAACLILFMLFLLIESIKEKNHWIIAVVIVISVYWYGYGFSVEQGALLGAILAMLEQQENRMNLEGEGNET